MTIQFTVGIRLEDRAIPNRSVPGPSPGQGIKDVLGDIRSRVHLWDRLGVDYAILGSADVSDSAGYLARLLPSHLIGYLAAATERIGLVYPFNPAFQEPYYAAKRLASLDLVADGRLGWLIAPDYSHDIAKLYGRQAVEETETARSTVEEFLSVLRQFWLSWEPGAVIRDRTRDLYFDLSKIHRVEHAGTHFTIRGVASIHSDAQREIPSFSEQGTIATGLGTIEVAHRSEPPTTAPTRPTVLELDLAAASSAGVADIVSAAETFAAVGGHGVLLRAQGTDHEVDFLDNQVLPALTRAGLLEPKTPSGTLTSRLGISDEVLTEAQL